MAAGYGHAVQTFQEVWELGTKAGVVDGSPQGALDDLLLTQSQGRRILTDPDFWKLALSLEQIERIFSAIFAIGLSPAPLPFEERLYLALVAATESFNAAVSETSFSSVIEAAAVKFGLHGDTEPAPFHFLDDASGAFTGALKEMMEAAPGRALYPYNMYVSRRIRTRPNHLILHELVWRVGHQDERLWLPPNGYNCFCRPVPVPFDRVLRLGWEGDFPLGQERLRKFLEMGGPDENFPKERFI